MKSKFLSPAVTIFDCKGRPDKEENHSLYQHLKNGGVSGFVIMGSTGEFYSLSMEESMNLIDIASEFPKEKMEVYAGASRMTPKESVILSNYAYDKGLDGVMIISPYYYPLTQENLFDFYSKVASRTKAKIFIYNFPDRTGCSISPETVLRLAEKYENIRGLKDTILDMGHTSDLIVSVKSQIPHFEIYSGYDNNFAHNILSGGSGCIGALSNIVPEFFAGFMEALDSENFFSIALFQREVDKMMDIYKIRDSFIPVIKKALVIKGIISSEKSAEPLREADDDVALLLSSFLENLDTGASFKSTFLE
ncbi:MAG: dihydrodipicolinate synthase family protein [Deltaproteobacteria bacterium]|jgi:4-hydroxy-tetrahydrodipicolinate synthase|nr:dihydrodipicolinate synthase family protein [Deltaproteobacteria bacterium]